MARLVEQDEAVVAGALQHHAAGDGRVLLIVRLHTAYGCSAFWYFPALSHTARPRYVVVYAAGVRSLLGTELRATKDALLTSARTLDMSVVAPRELGGALVASTEVGVLAKEVLRPSPRHFFLLSGEAGETVFSTPEGDTLRAAVADPALGIVVSRAFQLKLAGVAAGFIRKLRGLAVPRLGRKASRSSTQPEPSKERLLESLSKADTLAHLELCRSWLMLVTNRSPADDDHLKQLYDVMTKALDSGADAPPIGPVLDQWLAAANTATPASDRSSRAEDNECTARIRATTAGFLVDLREADLRTFSAAHPGLRPSEPRSGPLINQVPSSRLQSLLQTLDPRSLLPPHQIVFAVQSGSAMYNLATSASDEDYLLVFAASPGELLGFEPPADQIEFKGEVVGFGEDKGGVVEGSAMVSTFSAFAARVQVR